MYILGITGPSGSGKSVLCQYLAQSGVIHIDADAVVVKTSATAFSCRTARWTVALSAPWYSRTEQSWSFSMKRCSALSRRGCTGCF